MKIAVLNLSNRIADSAQSSIGSIETLNMMRLLQDGGNEVTAFTNILKADREVEDLNIEQISDNININKYDVIYLVNGTPNFFGGLENELIINNYKLLARFTGTIFYAFVDLALPLKQLWPVIQSKDWANKYKEEDFKITTKVVYLTQTYNTQAAIDIIKKQDVQVTNAIYFPFEKWIVYFRQLVS